MCSFAGGQRALMRSSKWWDHIAAFGAGGMATAVLLGVVIWQIVEAVKRA